MSTATFHVGDVFDVMAAMPDRSVDLVLTSPPFLALRSYLPADHPNKAKEIGSEGTPAEFIDVMLRLTAEWRRLLTPHGSIFVELGDTYSGSGGAGGDYGENGLREGQAKFKQQWARDRGWQDSDPKDEDESRTRNSGGPGWPLAKSLACIPALYQVALAYGIHPLTGQPSPAGRWRLRNEIAWVRPNPPVGALGDKVRPATSYAAWACVSDRRWFDLDAVRTASDSHVGRFPGREHYPGEKGPRANGTAAISDPNPAGAPPLDWWNHIDMLIDDELAERAKHPPTHKRTKGTQARSGKSAAAERGGNWFSLDEVEELDSDTKAATGAHIRRRLQEAGYLSGPEDWWEITPGGYQGAHYAVFPPELCVRPIEASCPRRVCRTCGTPSRRETSTEQLDTGRTTNGHKNIGRKHESATDYATRTESQSTTTGWSTCGCPGADGIRLDGFHDGPGWRPGHVLDPFGGTGTTAVVATGHGRDCTLIDIDETNVELARERLGMFMEVAS